MRTSIQSTIATVLVLLFTLLVVGPTASEASPLALPGLNALAARSGLGGLSSDVLYFSRLEKRKGKAKKKGLSGGVIAAIVIVIIVVIIVVAVFFFLRRRKALRG